MLYYIYNILLYIILYKWPFYNKIGFNLKKNEDP